MKVVGVFIMLLGISTSLTSLVVCSRGNAFTNSGMHRHNRDYMLGIGNLRKLKEKREATNGHNIELEDYRASDPVPSSKASLRPGPIQHGTPLMPYIPKHAPAPPPRSPRP